MKLAVLEWIAVLHRETGTRPTRIVIPFVAWLVLVREFGSVPIDGLSIDGVEIVPDWIGR